MRDSCPAARHPGWSIGRDSPASPQLTLRPSPQPMPRARQQSPFGIFSASRAGLITLTPETVDGIAWCVTVGRTILTFGFLLAIVQAMVFAGAASRKILSGLNRDEDPAHLRDLVAESLDDPLLELAFPVGGERTSFVSSHGVPIDPTSAAGEGRIATAIRSRDMTVGYIVHDAALATDPELLLLLARSDPERGEARRRRRRGLGRPRSPQRSDLLLDCRRRTGNGRRRPDHRRRPRQHARPHRRGGGELDIVSLPGRGTTVSGWVPAVTSESQGITT
jgi:hypothetical protein